MGKGKNNSGILTLFPYFGEKIDNCGVEFICFAQKVCCVSLINATISKHTS